MQVISLTSRPVWASETVTVDATAGGVGLTAATLIKQTGGDANQISRARVAFITVEDNEIRMNLDPGVTVTATTNGHELAAGTSVVLDGTAVLNDVRFIRTGAGSGVIRVTYYG